MIMQDRTVLVTGGATGIGAGIAALFAQSGAQVVIADIDSGRAAQMAEQLGSPHLAIPLDVSNDGAWQDAMASLDRLDVLVNCAGINPFGNVESLSLDDWHATMRVNLDGTFLGCKHAIPLLARSGGGSIINIASPVGVKPVAALIGYGASKAAVLNLTKSVALHCAQEGLNIRCNAVLPAAVHTEMTERFLKATGDYEANLAKISQGRPLGRLGTAADTAEAVLFLASDKAGFITGEALSVDGGALLV